MTSAHHGKNRLGRPTGRSRMASLQSATVLACLLASPMVVDGQAASGQPQLTPLPRDLEIELALSTLPTRLQDGATVYVLNPQKGFEVARQGNNGFSAFVARTGDDTFKGSWSFDNYRDDILYPIAFDAAGQSAQMQLFFDAAAMQAEGMPPQELKMLMVQREAAAYYPAPARAGISYMMSPILRGYTEPEHSDAVATMNFPHVMFYAPNVTASEVGGGKPGGMEPFVILQGRLGYMIQPLGVTERAARTKTYAPMLARLCKLKSEWCLPPAGQETSMRHGKQPS